MSASLVYSISSVILYVFWSLSVDLICERRFSFPLQILFHIIAGIGLLFISLQLPNLSGIRFFTGLFYFAAYSQLSHKGSRILILLVSVSIIAAVSLAETIYMFIMPREAAVSGALTDEHPILVYGGYMFVNLVVYSLVVLAFRFLRRTDTGVKPDWTWLLLPILPICQIITLNVYYTAYVGVGDILNRVGWTLIIYVICDVVLFLSIRISSKNALLKGRNEVLEEQLAAQFGYYEKLTREYEGIRRMRHDIDNHLYTIQALLKEEKVAEAAEYSMQIMKEDKAKLRFSGCENMVAAAYLDRKADDFEKQGIRFDTDILLPAGLSITNTDLICAFGNLMDNAEDACKGTEQPAITLKSVYLAPYLTLSCTNTDAPAVKNAEKSAASANWHAAPD